jgi:hypothetical protein
MQSSRGSDKTSANQDAPLHNMRKSIPDVSQSISLNQSLVYTEAALISSALNARLNLDVLTEHLNRLGASALIAAETRSKYVGLCLLLCYNDTRLQQW